jgi:hypothetical protein
VAVPESTVEFPSLSALVDDALVVNAQLGDPGVGASVIDGDGRHDRGSREHDSAVR